MSASDVELVRSAWQAIERGDIEGAINALDPAVRWYAAGDAGAEGGCHDRREAADYIRRALAEGVVARLLEVHDAGDRVVAVIDADVPAEWEGPSEPHGEVITVRDGSICEMVVHPSVAEAMRAAGLDTSG